MFPQYSIIITPNDAVGETRTPWGITRSPLTTTLFPRVDCNEHNINTVRDEIMREFLPNYRNRLALKLKFQNNSKDQSTLLLNQQN